MQDLKNQIRILTRQIFPKKRVKRITKLRKEASPRDFYRVTLSGHQSCVVMTLHRVPDQALLVNQIMDANEVFSGFHIRVPGIYRYFPDARILVLRDLGNVTLESFYVRHGARRSVDIYKQIIDAMLRIHHQSITPELQTKLPFQTRFTPDKLMGELDFFLEHSGFCDRDAVTRSLYRALFQDAVDRLCSERFVLTHRDLHSRNLHVVRDGFAVLDHQDARMGPYPYDLVSLVKDSYVDIPHKVEVELVAYYMERSREVWNQPLDFDTFFEAYYRCLLQRSLKAAGTFFYQVHRAGNPKYRKYIPRVLQYAVTAFRRLEKDNARVQQFEEAINLCVNRER